MNDEPKHPPHIYGDGYFMTADGVREHILVCKSPGCMHEKREVVNVP